MRPVVVTGVSGFIGCHVAKALLNRGVKVRGLARNRKGIADSVRDAIEVFEGDLTSGKVTEALTRGAEAVVHCAGAIRACSRQEFFATNVLGTQRMAETAERQGVARFVQVSSIAARETQLSDYAASKKEGEMALARAVRQMSWVIVRPPAVYGPGDRATLPLVRALSRRAAWLPGTRNARFSLIHVTDLAHALALLATTQMPGGACYEVDDGKAGGYGWSDLATAASHANAHPTRIVLMPKALVIVPALAASSTALLLGRPPLVSIGKLNELYHPDWLARGPRLEDASAWRPQRSLEMGLRQTMDWYRAQGWLRARPARRSDAVPRAGPTRS